MRRHGVRRAGRGPLALALVAAAVLVGCGDDGSDPVSPSVYAERLCAARQSFEEDFGKAITDALVSVRQTVASESVGDLRAAVATFEDVTIDLSAAFDTFLDEIAAAGTPDVEGGDEVRDGLDETVEKGRQNLQEADELVEELDPDSATAADFQATATAFQDTADTFLELDLTGGSQELTDAFNETDCGDGP